MADIDSGQPVRSVQDVDERVQVKVVDSTTVSQQLTVDSDGRAATRANLQVGQSDVSIANPVPVSIEESAGDEVSDYQTSAAIVKGASADHDYTVSASKTLIGKRVWASGSGFLKCEVKLETAAASGVYNNVFVGFNSTSNPNIDIALDSVLKQVTGANVRITITNLDNQAQDVYSTLLAVEV